MDFELSEEHRMLKDLVARFVRDELMPLEAGVLAREAAGDGLGIGGAEHRRLDEVSRTLGLWGLDAPEDVGGFDLPAVAMIGVNEELGRTITPYTLPPDSPNLRMLMATVTERQREAYLAPYVRGETVSAIGISEPGAGSDPAGMITKFQGAALAFNASWALATRLLKATASAIAISERARRSSWMLAAFRPSMKRL